MLVLTVRSFWPVRSRAVQAYHWPERNAREDVYCVRDTPPGPPRERAANSEERVSVRAAMFEQLAASAGGMISGAF